MKEGGYMKVSAFTARCKYEIGDVIATPDGKAMRITDICATHYIKTGKVIFTYELDNSGRYVLLQEEVAK